MSKPKRKIAIHVDSTLPGVSPLKNPSRASNSDYIIDRRPKPFYKMDEIPIFDARPTVQDIKNINSATSQLHSIQLMRVIMQNSLETLSRTDYFKKSPAIAEKYFKKTAQDVQNKLFEVKNERIQRLKYDTVYFERPDKDKFETHKTKHLTCMLNQQREIWDEKKKMAEESFAFSTSGKKIKEKVHAVEEQMKAISSTLTSQQFEREFTPILTEINDEDSQKLKERMQRVKQQLVKNLKASQQLMMLNHQNRDIEDLKRKKSEKQETKYLINKFGDKKIWLFNPTSYLILGKE